MRREITKEQARAILQILREGCGYRADPYNGEGFMHAITTVGNTHACTEYRFCGVLGFGGKFRNNGNNDNVPYVDCYPEDETEERRTVIEHANARLAELFNSIKTSGE